MRKRAASALRRRARWVAAPFAPASGIEGGSPQTSDFHGDEVGHGADTASVVHHCGSGVSAVPNLIAMEIAGLGRTGFYAGSWSEWCSDPTRPVAQG